VDSLFSFLFGIGCWDVSIRFVIRGICNEVRTSIPLRWSLSLFRCRSAVGGLRDDLTRGLLGAPSGGLEALRGDRWCIMPSWRRVSGLGAVLLLFFAFAFFLLLLITLYLLHCECR
jgi:hypothetical protein